MEKGALIIGVEITGYGRFGDVAGATVDDYAWGYGAVGGHFWGHSGEIGFKLHVFILYFGLI